MERYLSIAILFAFLVICGYVFWDGWSMMFRYKLFPFAVAVLIVAFVGFEIARMLLMGGRVSDGWVRAELHDDYAKRMLRILVIIGSYFGGVFAVGPVIASSAFVFFFLLSEARLPFWAVGLSAVALWGVLEGLFVYLLRLQLPVGFVYRWLA